MNSVDLPAADTADVHMLQVGYAISREDFNYASPSGAHIGPSIGLVLDGDRAIVIDPGFVADRRALLGKVRAAGIRPVEVTDIVLSHHHPDHTLNAALFPTAIIHDHWAIYHHDEWHSREADGALVSPSVRLIRTPGHTAEDITTLVATGDEVYAFTHAWATDEQPDDGENIPDTTFVLASRRRILSTATIVVPGHGPSFRPPIN